MISGKKRYIFEGESAYSYTKYYIKSIKVEARCDAR